MVWLALAAHTETVSFRSDSYSDLRQILARQVPVEPVTVTGR
jgi:hypothetical protein